MNTTIQHGIKYAAITLLAFLAFSALSVAQADLVSAPAAPATEEKATGDTEPILPSARPAQAGAAHGRNEQPSQLLPSARLLRWGADPDGNAPYAFYGGDDELTGFEYEIICAIAKEMGREPVFVQNDWDGLIPGLARGDMYDLVICGIEITPDKAGEVLFSDPYYITFEQFVGKKGSVAPETPEDFKGKRIGTLSQTAALTIIEEAEGIACTYFEEYNSYQDTASGRNDGTLLDYPIAKYYASPNPNLEFMGPPFGEVLYGIALEKNNTALKKEIDAALKKITDSGQLRDILSRWGLWTPTMAATLEQDEAPSMPDTEFKSFLASNAETANIWTRLQRYASNWPLLLRATILTLQVSVTAMLLAILVGFALALMRVYGPTPISWLAIAFIEIVRGTPLLVQLYIIFYGLPNIGISLSPFIAGVVGLGLNYAAYEAENYRAGLLSVPRGQLEAARALGMSHGQGLWHIVVPQSFRLVLPPVTNDFISLLKDSSLVSMVTLIDLTGAYNRMATQTFDYFGTGLLIAVIYLLIGLPFVRLARYTEKRLAVDTRKPGQRPGVANSLRR